MNEKVLSFVIIIFLIILSEAIAQSCLKKYNSGSNITFLLLACVFYLTVILLLCKSYNYEGMYQVNLYWSIGSIIIILLADVLIFHAELKKEDIFGVILCLTGLYFIYGYNH